MANKLEQTAKQQNIIIRLGHLDTSTHQNYINMLKSWLENINNKVSKYAFIYHDKDIKVSVNENGEVSKVPKKPHIHLFIEYLPKAKKRLSTTLNQLATYLNIVPDSIVIESCENDIGTLQYLIHKNDIDKHQYSESDIIHNFEVGELHNILTLEGSQLNAKSLRHVVISCHGNKWLIMNEIGLAYYKNYRGVISDLIECYQNGDIRPLTKEEYNK